MYLYRLSHRRNFAGWTESTSPSLRYVSKPERRNGLSEYNRMDSFYPENQGIFQTNPQMGELFCFGSKRSKCFPRTCGNCTNKRKCGCDSGCVDVLSRY